MLVAPRSRTLWLAGHFSACSLGSSAKPGDELQAHALHPPGYTLHSAGLPPAPLLRPRRAPTGRHPSREGEQSGCPAAGPVGPRWTPRCPPAPRFPKLAANAAASRAPHPQAANFVPSSEGAILAKFVRQSPTPYLRWGRAARAARAPGPPGAARSAQPGTHRGVATVAAARAPRRPRGASASPSGGRGLGAPGRGRARGPRLPAVALGHYRPPARLCAAARCARSGGEQATTNGDISRRSTWRAERAGVPRRRGRQPSPHRRDVGERARCSHPAAH